MPLTSKMLLLLTFDLKVNLIFSLMSQHFHKPQFQLISDPVRVKSGLEAKSLQLVVWYPFRGFSDQTSSQGGVKVFPESSNKNSAPSGGFEIHDPTVTLKKEVKGSVQELVVETRKTAQFS